MSPVPWEVTSEEEAVANGQGRLGKGQLGAKQVLCKETSLLCMGTSNWKKQPSPHSMWAGVEGLVSCLQVSQFRPGRRGHSHCWRLLPLTSPTGRLYSFPQMPLWHFHAWANMPCKGLPPLASQPHSPPKTSAGCLMAQSGRFLGVLRLVVHNYWISSYCVNPESMGVLFRWRK